MIKSLGLGVLFAFATCSATGTPLPINPNVGGTSFFTAVRTQIERDETTHPECGPYSVDPLCIQQTNMDTSLAESGNKLSAYAKGRSEYGVNGAYASVSVSFNQDSYAESIWSDAFIVHGSTGQSTAKITIELEGSLDGLGRPGGPGSNSYYTLFVSDTPISCNFDKVYCTGNAAIPLTEAFSGVSYLEAMIEFTYDTPFYVASYLGAEVVAGQTGLADFFHSAHFGISAPDGADITTASGTTYQAAATVSVPEPTSFAILIFGLLFIGVCRKRSKQSIAARVSQNY